MIKIVLIHPSYKRVDMAFNTCLEWLENCGNPMEVEYLIGLDNGDPTIEKYKERFESIKDKWGRFEINVGDSTDSVKASYRVAKTISTTTEILFQISDDTGSVCQWDYELIKSFSIVDNFKEPKALFVNDGYWPFGTVFVHPIMNRALYNKLGFILYPDYTSMFADNDFTEVCRKLNCFIEVPQLTFQHKHYSKGFNTFDETYAKRNNQQEFNKNQQIFIARQKRNFDL